MVLWTLTLMMALAIVPPATAGSETKTPLTVTYVANEGFMIECRGKKVAIDALFGGWESDYCYMPPDSTIQLMKTAQPPFDSIDVIAVTHCHEDHFEPGIVASHLRHDPRSILVCTPQVAERLAGQEGYSGFSSRIRPISAPADSMVAMNVNGLEIVALTGKHGSYVETDTVTGEKIDRHRNVQHLEYVITMCGRKIYHGGDAPLDDMERYERLGFGRDTINLALAQWFTPGEIMSFREKLLRKVLGAKTIILMHLPLRRDLSGREQRKACAERDIILPQKLMEQWTIP